ncbi:MAG: 1-deoxy-D-xylulose-5-phosphate reductoisomerase [Dehalococcoidales bacterium]|nr:1-deoxy-D-xylulose-5-phosphate reductoisomerase [Dehalococcoidales bacterium]
MALNNSPVKLAVLGSTGSIGQQTLDIVRTLPEKFKVISLSAGQNRKLLEEQITEFKPWFVYYQGKPEKLPAGVKFLVPEEISTHPDTDIVVNAISGTAGLNPALAAIRAGKKVALSNKESIVMAGEILIREAKRNKAKILPVDSEPSAIWQCLRGEKQKAKRLIITASGGPFLHYSATKMKTITAAQALKHPSWRMGKKITIDSATLMNKGLEVIEAHWLFDFPFEDIKVVIHPQSIIHSMVEFQDGATKAQLSLPDMRFPIMYALSYPQRLVNPQLPRLDWDTIDKLTFEVPDSKRFPCLKLAIEAGKQGGTYPAVLCGADEIAVEAFLAGRINFTDIFSLVEKALSKHKNTDHPALEEIITAADWAKNLTRKLLVGK